MNICWRSYGKKGNYQPENITVGFASTQSQPMKKQKNYFFANALEIDKFVYHIG